MEIDLDAELGLISEAAYAAFVNKTLPSVRNERSLGRGPPYVKIGKTIKYPVAAVKAYVAPRTPSPPRNNRR